MVGRQAQRANLVRETEPAIVLHRPGLRGVRLGVERSVGLGVDEQRADAATPELDCEHQPARPASDDQDVDLQQGPRRLREPLGGSPGFLP